MCVMCAFSLTVQIFCWGSNLGGQLGDGTTMNRSNPVRAGEIVDAIAVSTSGPATCALRSNGEVMCWGSGRGLGAGRTDNDPEPTPQTVIGLADVFAIDGADFGITTCAIHGPERAVVCWGQDLAAYAEHGTIEDSLAPYPVEIAGLRGVADISVGGFHACVVLADGSVRCWGEDGYGQLGDGTMDSRTEPTLVVLP